MENNSQSPMFRRGSANSTTHITLCGHTEPPHEIYEIHHSILLTIWQYLRNKDEQLEK